MSNLHRPEDVTAYNESALEELAWAIEASVGQFKLFLARCNYTSLRSQMVERLRELTSVEIRILELKTSEKTLYARIQAELESEQPDALMVFGLEAVGDLDELLSATNQVREEFRKNFHFPLVLWVNDEVLKKLLQLAPDFESWATTTEFVVATDELVGLLRETAEQFFEGNLTLTLSVCREIKLACQDVQSREQGLGLELRANIESLLGLTEYVDYVNRNLDKALEHYQKGLELWQQGNNLERQGQLLSDIAFCYYLKALQYREIDHPDWQATRHYIRQSLEVFEAAQRPDLVANSILSFGRVLRRLQEWEQLQALAQKALQQHQTENRPIELAQDYGFLAEVALAKKRWTEAKEFAQKALAVLSAVPSLQSANSSGAVYKLPDKSVISYAPSRYRFILGQAQQHLDQPQEAIRNLEAAKRLGSPEHDTQLYLDILCHLQKLYFEQKEYLKAFEIKLERQSIEQQYGFRAFVGAGWIKPQRWAKVVLTQAESQENVAPEITASGRQLDVDRLIERIGRNDRKLIIIHGQSGVGKSSLVAGGLMPGLKQKAIGTSNVWPVLMRVYNNWVAELGRLLAEALEERGRGETVPLDSVVVILEKLRQNESHNLRTVLIFDQFEEFFFVYPNPAERRRFFEFLGECLKILPVKVILSLREDYLHYLLECNHLDSMKIIGNDILSRNVLYELGNFSPDDAKRIIERLTERSNCYLEPALIEELVRDLASELGKVRPIELQIVGAQLQTEEIATLAEYKKRGHKEELVKHYLDEVVSDCGAENEQAANLILYLLTDEKGTRPLKTRAELERDLDVLAVDLTGEASRLDLVLQIFVKSGLVLLLPENPDKRYQLVHDYLAVFIRQQKEPRLKELMAELERERTQRKLMEKERNRVLRRALIGSIAAGCVLAILAVTAGGFAWRSEDQRKLAELREIKALSNSSEAFLGSDRPLDALITSLKAAGKLREAAWATSDIRIQVLATLQQAIYGERKPYSLDLEGHQNWVSSFSFNPNGKILATASADYTVKLWTRDGTQLRTLTGHSDGVNSVSFSPDGRTLATASADKTVKLWTLDGTLLKTLTGHSDTVTSVSFSPDGKILATASADNTVKLWTRDGTQLRTLAAHSAGVNSVSFSPDGRILATASADNTVKLWRLDGILIKTHTGHSAEVNSVSFSPDGRTLATASADKTVKLWTLDGTLLKTLTGHSDTVTSVSFSPDGQTIATTSADQTVKLWNPNGLPRKEPKTFEGFGDGVSIFFSSDGKTFATTRYSDPTVKLWSFADGKQVRTLKVSGNGVSRISFSPDGKTLAAATYNNTSYSSNTVKLWSLADGKEIRTINGFGDGVSSISFSPDGKTLATASYDTVKLWSLADDKEPRTINGFGDGVSSISFSPDGKILATASYDKKVRLWSLADSKEIRTIEGHSKTITSISFTPDSKILATASNDETIKLWNWADGEEIRTIQGKAITSIGFSPDSNTFFTATDDSKVILLDFNIDSLVVNSCSLLNDYLTVHPEVLVELKECQSASILVKAAPTLIVQGEELARKGDIQEAVAKFRKAQEWNASLDFNPKTKAQQLANQEKAQRLVAEGEELVQQSDTAGAVAKFQEALRLDSSLGFDPKTKAKQVEASVLVTKGENLLTKGNVKEAIAAYTEAQKLDPKVKISAYSWNSLCRDGSLRGYAVNVMFACEKAVALAPEDGDIRDSRGLARALTSNKTGAIEDFQVYINQTEDKESKSQRQRWINALRAGKNPFTPEEIKSLLNQ
jgi:WD40 repeat protein